MTKSTLVTTATTGHVAVLTLNRPEALNALSNALMEELARALLEADADPEVRVVLLTGSDRAFSAGADIGEIEAISSAEMLAPDGFARRLFDVVVPYRKPLIAATRGLVLGGGCELALACDLIIAGESARFGLPEVTLGIIPGAGGTQRIVHALGKSKAMQLLLSGDAISAQEACQAGLVSEVVPDQDCLLRAMQIAERIARNAPLAVQLAKDAARSSFDTNLSQGVAHERRNFFLLLNTADLAEGIQASTTKRAPKFAGR